MRQHTQGEQRRKTRISMSVRGTHDRPRLSIFRSSKAMHAQVIDDEGKKTLFGVSEKLLKDTKGTKMEKAKALGMHLATLAKEKKVTKVVFDKGPYMYHGRVKAFADGAREGGLEF